MSTFFSLRRSADEDGRTAGGKIVRNRSTRVADRTPYARPLPVPPPAEEPVAESSGNPNWLSGLIYPARAVASGAGRIFSSVFGPESYSSSSVDDSEDEDDASNAAEVDMNKVLSSMNSKSETMHLIQQLVMRHTFSREECDEFIKLIRSRAVEGDGNPNNTDLSNNAVMEARKWCEENKSSHEALSLATHSEMGSPVDIAKSYMKDQPAWSSPALKRAEFSTSSPVRHVKDIFHSPVQLSERNGSPLSTGSWNILDEVRRVRAKASEELLATTPSKNISFPPFSLGDKSMQDSTAKTVYDEKTRDLTGSNPNKSLDLHATNGCRVPESVQMECEKSQGGVLQINNVIGDSDADNAADHDAISNQLDGSRLFHEVNGLRDSATNDHALSLSAADQTREPPLTKETPNMVDSSPEKVQLINEHANHATEDDRHFSASQDSSSILYMDSPQDVNQENPNPKGKATRPGRKLRPRKKGPAISKTK